MNQFNNSSLTNPKSFQTSADNKEKFSLKNINFQINGDENEDFALNFNASLLYIACEQVKIIICFTCNGKLKIISSIKIKGYQIQAMRKHNGFIIVDEDGNFHIFKNHKVQGWVSKIISNTNFNYDQTFDCVFLINKNDDLLINSTEDNELKFWYQTKNWECITIKTGEQIVNLNLNDKEDKLVTLRWSQDLCIFQREQNNWAMLQIIRIKRGQSACFISNDIFVVSMIKKDDRNNSHRSIGRAKSFIWNEDRKKFQFVSESHVAGHNDGYSRYPIYYIQEKQLLFITKQNYVNVFKVNENGQLIIQYKLRFQREYDYEDKIQISQNGEFLVFCHQKGIIDYYICIKKLRRFLD